MRALKWLDEHFEESILIFLLAMISIVELMQVVCRNVDFIPSLTWAEEMCRFLWIATVFVSLPYTVRTGTMLRVTALIDVLPWRAHNVINIAVDAVVAAALLVLGFFSVQSVGAVVASGELSSAMLFPMWILYAIVMVGFFAGALRSLQMLAVHVRDVNVRARTAVEEEAAFELSQAEAGAREGGDA